MNFMSESYANPALAVLIQAELQENPQKFYTFMLEKQPRFVVKELVKSGLKITPENIKKFLVFSIFGIPRINFIKDNQLQEDYKNKIIRIKGKPINTDQVFDYVFKDCKTNFVNANHLIKNCGYGSPDVFRYAHEKHLQTGKRREGANYFFIHPLRVWENLESKLENVPEEKLKLIRDVSLLHDVVEEMLSYRGKKFRQLIEEQNGHSKRIPTKNIPRKIALMLLKDDETTQAYNLRLQEPEIKQLHKEIQTPPEYREIYSLFPDEDYADLVLTFISSLTKQAGSKEDSLNNLVTIGKLLYEENNSFYDVAILVKLGDMMDNTTTLQESGANAQLYRFKKNLIFLESLDEQFLSVYETENQNVVLLRKELINISIEEIQKLVQTYHAEQGEEEKIPSAEKKDYDAIIKKLNYYQKRFEFISKH